MAEGGEGSGQSLEQNPRAIDCHGGFQILRWLCHPPNTRPIIDSKAGNLAIHWLPASRCSNSSLVAAVERRMKPSFSAAVSHHRTALYPGNCAREIERLTGILDAGALLAV